MARRPTYEELRRRVAELESECAECRTLLARQEELEQKLTGALAKILSGYIPICARCKRIRDGTGKWSQLESYLQTHTEAVFSHSLCPFCARIYFPDLSGEIF
jgi:hypothetical protein